MGGGDLLNLLIERDVFEEDFTRFYIAEVIYHLPWIPCFLIGFYEDGSSHTHLSSSWIYSP